MIIINWFHTLGEGDGDINNEHCVMNVQTIRGLSACVGSSAIPHKTKLRSTASNQSVIAGRIQAHMYDISGTSPCLTIADMYMYCLVHMTTAVLYCNVYCNVYCTVM